MKGRGEWQECHSPGLGRWQPGKKGHVGINSQVCNLLQSIDGLGQTKSNAFMKTRETQDGWPSFGDNNKVQDRHPSFQILQKHGDGAARCS